MASWGARGRSPTLAAKLVTLLVFRRALFTNILRRVLRLLLSGSRCFSTLATEFVTFLVHCTTLATFRSIGIVITLFRE
jgi:hypothetical protein